MKATNWLVMVGALATLAASNAAAQELPRAATVRVGGLMYDRGGDATNLLLGLGIDWALSRNVLAEVEGTWSRADDTYLDFSNPTAPVSRETGTHLATATAGVQAQAVLGRVRPYLGMSAGLFVKYDEKDGGDRFPRYTVAFPAGLRIDVTERMALRGELRARFDTHQDGGSGTNLEQSLGLSVRF